MPVKKALFTNLIFVFMAKSVLQKPLSIAHPDRNAFDVGYTNKFTSSLGMLLPCYVRECNPNEHYRINPRMLCRSMPMNSAAFIQCTQNVEFYFVPYRLLWTSFPQWFVGTNFDVTTSRLSEEKSTFPAFDLGKIFHTIIGNTVATQYSDVLGYSLTKGALRLLDLLGYGDLSHFDDITNLDIESVKVSPFRLLAYQKVCSDYYRVANYEKSRVRSYNVDQPATLGTGSWQTFVSNYLQLRYRPWKKDLYTISSISFQGNDFMSNSLSAPVFPDTIRDANANPDSDTKGHNYQGYLSVNTSLNNAGITVANLRSAFALDKLYRLSAQAGDGDYKSQIRARFGFDPYAPQYKSQFVGAVSAPVKIDQVTTTADTLSSNGSVGTPAGRIYGNAFAQESSGIFEYDVKEHGILIGLSSFVPDVDYSSYGINPFNTKIRREDYFQPEFDNLGKQPLSSLCFNPWKKVDVPTGGVTNHKLQLVNSVLGWFPRYVEYKTSVDEVHGQLNGWLNRSFDSAPTLSLWTAPRFNSSDSKKFDNWRDNGLSLDFFYIDPNIYDSIFVNQYRGDQSEDQFICEVTNNVQAILPMSVSGEPLI